MTADEALAALVRNALEVAVVGAAFYAAYLWLKTKYLDWRARRDYVAADEAEAEPHENEAQELVRTGSDGPEPRRTSLDGLTALQNAALAELLTQRDAPALVRFLATLEGLSGNNIEAMVKGTRSDILKMVQEARKTAEAPPLVVRDHTGVREISREVVS